MNGIAIPSGKIKGKDTHLIFNWSDTMSGTTLEPEHLRTVYKELCTSYRSIDDFRTKLLSLLPLATGGLFFFIADPEKAGKFEPSIWQAIGLFGLAIALGLFCFELYGIRKCTCLIVTGRYLEQKLDDIPGQFSERPPGVFFGLINEPFAAGIIYPAVMAAWTFLAAMGSPKAINPQALDCALGVFIVGLLLTLCFMYWLVKTEIRRIQDNLAKKT